jgi:hypothetical protein
MSSTSPYAEPKDLKPGDFLQSTWGDLFYVEKMQKNGLARVVNCSTGYKTKVEPNLFFLPSKKLAKQILFHKQKELHKQLSVVVDHLYKVF